MKIVGFATDAGLRLGVIEGDQVIDLQAVDPSVPNDLAAVLRRHNGDLRSLAELAERAPMSARQPLAGIKYGLPVARPGKIICLGLNYLEHVKEGRYADNLPKFPTLFARGLNSVVPHQHPLTRPRLSETYDYETEIIAVIGKRDKKKKLKHTISRETG
jgi:2-keto-4-pentenoate hydratase/2-oxohepta-3-ene-1,7-dioic acid hydratase in catechol pathway